MTHARMTQRTIEGWVQLPPEDPGTHQGQLLVELRDVSMLDAPSRVVASASFHHAGLSAGQRLPFRLDVPATASAATVLNLRVQLQGQAAAVTGAGPLFLTTQAVPVPPLGDVQGLAVPVEKVSG